MESQNELTSAFILASGKLLLGFRLATCTCAIIGRGVKNGRGEKGMTEKEMTETVAAQLFAVKTGQYR